MQPTFAERLCSCLVRRQINVWKSCIDSGLLQNVSLSSLRNSHEAQNLSSTQSMCRAQDYSCAADERMPRLLESALLSMWEIMSSFR